MTGTSFRYRAANGDGLVERGVISAPNRDAAVGQLASRGLYAIDLRAESVRRMGRSGLPVGDLALGLRLLADLLDAGLPMTRALHALESIAPPSFAALLPPLAAAVREGQTLSHALTEARVAVPPEVLGIVRAGERGSGLASAIRQAATLCEESAATRAAVRGALAYPMLLAVAGTVSLALLVGVVIPRFATILGDLGQSLPTSTRIVLRAGALARGGALPLIGAMIISGIAWTVWTSTEDGLRRWHATLLRLPVIGEARAAGAAARFSASLAALLDSGVPMGQALRSAAPAAGDAEIMARIALVRRDVEHGSRLSTALAAHDAVTPVVQRLVRAGEESGRLVSMLEQGARMERERVARRIATAVRLIEPALIVTFGGVVALVAAALLQALYSIRPGA